MGVFIVNSEGTVDSVLGYGEILYSILMVAGFFLIWNSYKPGFKAAR